MQELGLFSKLQQEDADTIVQSSNQQIIVSIHQNIENDWATLTPNQMIRFYLWLSI